MAQVDVSSQENKKKEGKLTVRKLGFRLCLLPQDTDDQDCLGWITKRSSTSSTKLVWLHTVEATTTGTAATAKGRRSSRSSRGTGGGKSL